MNVTPLRIMLRDQGLEKTEAGFDLVLIPAL